MIKHFHLSIFCKKKNNISELNLLTSNNICVFLNFYTFKVPTKILTQKYKLLISEKQK